MKKKQNTIHNQLSKTPTAARSSGASFREIGALHRFGFCVVPLNGAINGARTRWRRFYKCAVIMAGVRCNTINTQKQKHKTKA